MKWIRRLIFLYKNARRCSILTAIEHADEQLIQDAIQAVIRRYSSVFPDWEVVFYALPKKPQKRRQEVERLIHMLRTYESQPPKL